MTPHFVMSFYFYPLKMLGVGHYSPPHFTIGQTEAQRDDFVCPGAHSLSPEMAQVTPSLFPKGGKLNQIKVLDVLPVGLAWSSENISVKSDLYKPQVINNLKNSVTFKHVL